jgi:hypothetical protein
VASIETVAASSGGHWYLPTGEQVATVPSADGKKQVRPDIRHARKLGLAPGVTTIMGCAHREDLVRWQITQGIMAALTLTRGDHETDASFIARAIEDSKKQVQQAADIGTVKHAAVQAYFEGQIPPERHAGTVHAAIQALEAACGPQDWRSERGCASGYGYGTKADLSSPDWIVDIKTKDGSAFEFADLKLYDSHPMQLAATSEALGGRGRHGGILFLSRTHDDVARFVPAAPDEMERGLGMFLCLLRYWQVKHRHRPEWATKEIKL